MTLTPLEKTRRPRAADPPRVEPQQPPKGFILEPWASIAFDGREEWAIKRILPRQGLAVIYGKPGSFKSFVASHLALSISLGWHWAGRRVTPSPVIYIAAEGAAGLRKRKAGFTIRHPDLPADVPFSLIPMAPNLGSEKGDLNALVSAIDTAKVRPGLIVLDTLAQTLGAGDENGSGMTAFIANARAISDRFKCLVLIVHHVGLSDDKRMRGHSSLHGALDAQILCEREEGQLAASLTLQKVKDEACDVRLIARLERVVIAHDDDGDEISTLVVDTIEDAEPRAEAPRSRSIPRTQRLLMSLIAETIGDAGEKFKPFANDGPLVRGVSDRVVRDRYFARIAETADPDEDAGKLFDRQRKGFKRSIEAALKEKALLATERKGERFVWLP